MTLHHQSKGWKAGIEEKAMGGMLLTGLVRLLGMFFYTSQDSLTRADANNPLFLLMPWAGPIISIINQENTL